MMAVSPEKIAEMLAAAEHVPNGEWTLDGHEIIASRRYPIATVDRHSRDAEAIKAYLLLCHPDAISDLLAEVTSNRSEILTLRAERDEAREWCEACGSLLYGGSCPICSDPDEEPIDWQSRALAAEAQLARQGEALKPFARLGDIILAEAPADAKTVVVFTSASGEKFSLQLDQFRAARSTLSPEDSHG